MRAEQYRWQCTCCGKAMVGLPMDLAYQRPDRWDDLGADQKAQSLLQSDFCCIRPADGSEAYFIRALLPIPVVDFEAEFRFGVWVAVSRESFRIYADGFKTDIYRQESCIGHIANAIPDVASSLGLETRVWFENGGLRPRLELPPSHHPLFHAQANGVDSAQVERWVAPRMAH